MSTASKVGPTIKARIFAKTFNRCAYCGKPIDFDTDYSIDHAVPESLGGRATIDNLFLCCIDCNQIKDSMTVEQFRAYIENKMPETLEKSMEFRVAEKFGVVSVTRKRPEFFFEKLKRVNLDHVIDTLIDTVEEDRQ